MTTILISSRTDPAAAGFSRYAGFESGTFAEWGGSASVPHPNPYGASVRVDGSRSYQGKYSARAHTGPGPGIQYARTLWGGTTGTASALNWGEGKDLWYGMALYLPAGFSSSMQSYFVPMRWDTYGTSHVSWSGLAMYGDGRWRLFRRLQGGERETNLLAGTFRLSEGRWHRLEVHQKLSRTSGKALNRLYVDGRKLGESSARNYYGKPVSAIRFGIVATDQFHQTKPLTVWYDRVSVTASGG